MGISRRQDDVIKLDYDRETHTTSSPPGVQVRIPGFGSTSSVEYLTSEKISQSGYMIEPIENVLLPLGYKRDVDLRAAPYDFRKAPNEMHQYFENLRELIEEMYHETGRKVVLLSHSMGSNIARYFLIHHTQEWKDSHIETLISVAGAWGGTVKTLKAFTSGYNFGIPFLNSKAMLSAEMTFPSMAYMMPSGDVWNPDEVFIVSKVVNVTVSNYNELFAALDYEDGYSMHLDTKDLDQIQVAPGVSLHCISSSKVDTPEKFFYDGNNLQEDPVTIMGDGDGTVNRRSLDLCLKWKDLQEQEIQHTVYEYVDHLSILSFYRFYADLRKIVVKIMNDNRLNYDYKIELEKRAEEIRTNPHFSDVLWHRDY
ncbi:lysosomal phospholipase A and acyltransferase-like [Palaemon carinicauda]|uniref:lysosomal phospholipase A and acyltransferase-like n=1 Tax=Palaemon carinicauda TaxID=392227 RepID=UPI0035B69130